MDTMNAFQGKKLKQVFTFQDAGRHSSVEVGMEASGPTINWFVFKFYVNRATWYKPHCVRIFLCSACVCGNIHVVYNNSFFLIPLLGVNSDLSGPNVLHDKTVQGSTIDLQTGDIPNIS